MEHTEIEMYDEMARVLSEEYEDENELWVHMQIPALEYFFPEDEDLEKIIDMFGDVMSPKTRGQIDKILIEGI